MTYKERIINALQQLGGHAYLKDIYKVFENSSEAQSLPDSYQAIIRATLERYSSDSTSFDQNEDLFYSVDGIGNGHWGLRNFTDTLELTQEDDEFSEGKISLKLHLQRERNPKLISDAKKLFIKKHGRLYCEICGFDFHVKYGELGANYIEAHHVKPVSTMKSGDRTKIEDIIMVCSNCHSMIHRKRSGLGIDDLKAILKV